MKANTYIKHNRNINKTGLLSAFTFLLLALTCLFPISKSEQTTEAVTETVQSSSLTLNVSNSAASVELDVNSNTGTFASSTTDNSANFSVTTSNFSGYTLTISGNDDEGKLYDSTKQNFLTSLANATSETDFSSTSNTNLNGQWGYKPSKFNSVVNDNYLPAPTTEASTLDKTSAANTTANDYSISLGLRADYTTTADTYSNSFIITAVPNPIAYVITYDANTTDTVSNMPSAQNSTTSATSITLSSTTPTRSHYSFLGWCSVVPTSSNGTDACPGTTYQPNGIYGIDQTTENITTLYAMWKIDTFTVTFSAGTGGSVNRTSQASIPYGTAVTTSTNTVSINGTTTTATASTGYSFGSWTNNCGSTMPASNCTITANWIESTPTFPNYTLAQCQADATSAAATIKDPRDGQTYRIRYINGICTMVDNLNFNMTSGMTLSPDTTNVKSTKTIATVGALSSGNTYTEALIATSSTSGYGTYYNYCAATAGEICVDSSTAEATEDVCPAGWRLPTGNNGGEQFILNNSYTFQSWNANYPAEFLPVAAGYYGNGSLYNSGSLGYWWSSTASGSTLRYYLLYRTSNGLYSGHHGGVREYGVSVRCVLK